MPLPQSAMSSISDRGGGRRPTDEVCVRPATKADADYIVDAIEAALAPYYEGNHQAHARRLISTHLAGGQDVRGLLSARQVLLVLWRGNERRGVLNLALKRQETCKISPLIVYPDEDRQGLGTALLQAAEEYALRYQARQLYCTVAERNTKTLDFLRGHGFIVCGWSPDQYKAGEREVFLRMPLTANPQPSPSTISVTTAGDEDWPEVRLLLLRTVREEVQGATEEWLDRLRLGTEIMPQLERAEKRPAWVYMARDRDDRLRAAAIVSEKKGNALKIMPVAAADAEGFEVLVIDLPSLLAGKGRKAYIHLTPDSQEVAVLQCHGWKLEAMLPEAYHEGKVTQQWAISLLGDDYVRNLRIRDHYLQMIKEGRKTLEIRVAYEHLKSIKAGDVLRLLSSKDEVMCDVLGVRTYPSFERMLARERSSRALPDVKPGEALRRLRGIYPRAKERLGVIVIELRVAGGAKGWSVESETREPRRGHDQSKGPGGHQQGRPPGQ
jgi:ASC-1-like (ASCH) protein/ribosomal protein S18 acetylase RimI-like enzyme